MSEANKALVRRCLRAMTSGDPALPDLLTEDVTWWVPPSSPLGGLKQGKAAVLELMGSGIGLYDASVPFGIEVETIVAEGEWVALQMVMTQASALASAAARPTVVTTTRRRGWRLGRPARPRWRRRSARARPRG